MNFKIGFILSALFLLLFSCVEKNNSIVLKTSSSQIIKMVFEKAYTDKVIDMDTFQFENPFHDSILFESKNLFSSYYPIIGNFKIKLMTEKQMCDYIYSDTQRMIGLSVWQLNKFMKTDTSYEVNIQRISLFPNFDKNGKPMKGPSGIYEGKEKCSFIWLDKTAHYRVTIKDGKFVIKLVDFSWGDH